MSFKSRLIEFLPSRIPGLQPDLCRSGRDLPLVLCSLIYFFLGLLVNGNHDKVYISRHTHMPWPYKYPMMENGTIAPILVRMKEKRKVGRH